MNPIDPASLADMTIRMLERTAMVLAERAEPGADLAPPTRAARIAYHGPSAGTVTLGATDGFLRELAASLLGVELSEVNVETQGHDALREMANIVGGSVILAMSGEVCEYSLGLPELVPVEATAGSGVECVVVADGGALRVRWVGEPTAKAA